jgi:hypothetical protein
VYFFHVSTIRLFSALRQLRDTSTQCLQTTPVSVHCANASVWKLSNTRCAKQTAGRPTLVLQFNIRELGCALYSGEYSRFTNYVYYDADVSYWTTKFRHSLYFPSSRRFTHCSGIILQGTWVHLHNCVLFLFLFAYGHMFRSRYSTIFRWNLHLKGKIEMCVQYKIHKSELVKYSGLSHRVFYVTAP